MGIPDWRHVVMIMRHSSRFRTRAVYEVRVADWVVQRQDQVTPPRCTSQGKEGRRVRASTSAPLIVAGAASPPIPSLLMDHGDAKRVCGGHLGGTLIEVVLRIEYFPIVFLLEHLVGPDLAYSRYFEHCSTEAECCLYWVCSIKLLCVSEHCCSKEILKVQLKISIEWVCYFVR
jgi:hypothetical protein